MLIVRAIVKTFALDAFLTRAAGVRNTRVYRIIHTGAVFPATLTIRAILETFTLNALLARQARIWITRVYRLRDTNAADAVFRFLIA